MLNPRVMVKAGAFLSNTGQERAPEPIPGALGGAPRRRRRQGSWYSRNYPLSTARGLSRPIILGGPLPGFMPFLARWTRILVMTSCSRMTLTILIGPPQLEHTIGSIS